MHKLSAQRPFLYMSAHKSEQQPNDWMTNDFFPRLLDESREENAQLHLFGKFCRREQKKFMYNKNFMFTQLWTRINYLVLSKRTRYTQMCVAAIMIRPSALWGWKHFILEDCRSHHHSCNSKCISQNMLPKNQIFVYTVAAIWKSFVIKRTNSYLYYGQKWSTWSQQSVVNTDYSTEERNSVKACTWATCYCDNICVRLFGIYTVQKNTVFTALTTLKISDHKNPQ